MFDAVHRCGQLCFMPYGGKSIKLTETQEMVAKASCY